MVPNKVTSQKEGARAETANRVTLMQSACADDSAQNITGVVRAATVVKRLLAADGCAWHREQTPASLLRYLLEEAYEVIDAVERELPAEQIAEELGDVLYQVLLHAELAAAAGSFDIDMIGERLAAKLEARHPHVFGELGYKSAAELTQMWEQLKTAAKPQTAAAQQIFAGIPAALPTLAKSQKIVERLERAGVDPLQTLANFTVTDAQSAYGAELFELVVRASKEGVDVDAALRQVLNAVTQTAAG